MSSVSISGCETPIGVGERIGMEVFNPELRILIQKDEESTGLILATPVLHTAKGVDNAINTAKTTIRSRDRIIVACDLSEKCSDALLAQISKHPQVSGVSNF